MFSIRGHAEIALHDLVEAVDILQLRYAVLAGLNIFVQLLIRIQRRVLKVLVELIQKLLLKQRRQMIDLIRAKEWGASIVGLADPIVHGSKGVENRVDELGAGVCWCWLVVLLQCSRKLVIGSMTVEGRRIRQGCAALVVSLILLRKPSVELHHVSMKYLDFGDEVTEYANIQQMLRRPHVLLPNLISIRGTPILPDDVLHVHQDVHLKQLHKCVQLAVCETFVSTLRRYSIHGLSPTEETASELNAVVKRDEGCNAA